MRLRFRSMVASCAALLLGAAGSVTAADVADSVHCAAVDIANAGWPTVAALRTAPGVEGWIELGHEMLLCGGEEDLSEKVLGATVVRRAEWVLGDGLLLARGLAVEELEIAGYRVLANDRAYAIVEAQPGARSPVSPHGRHHQGCRRARLDPIALDTVVLSRSANRPARKQITAFAPEIAGLVAQVNENRWFDDVVTLAGWNRYTHGSEIHTARDWLAATFSAMPGLSVSTPSFTVGSTTAYNVLAVLDGATRPDDWVIVGGHYDATSESPTVAAPGAEDNASGCAGVVELARILTASPPEATVLFMCYSGEEQGLYGSAAHAADLEASGDDVLVVAMINMDMIGYNQPGSVLDVLLETRAVGTDVMAILDQAATQFTTLETSTTLFAWGSDHVPYLNRDMPAVLTIEDDWAVYPDYHSTNDVPANLTIEMGREILKMNVAAVAHIAGAGTGGLFGDSFESGDLSRWSTTFGIQ